MVKNKNIITITLVMENTNPIVVVAPSSWGDNIEEVGKKLSQELNNEDETFVVIGDRVLRRVHIESAIIKISKVS